MVIIPAIFWVGNKYGNRRLTLVMFAVIMFGIVATLSYGASQDMKFERLLHLDTFTSSEARVGYARRAFDQFLQDPIWGHAVVEEVSGTYPHNIVVETLMATGLTGGILLLLIYLRAVRCSFQLLSGGTYAWLAVIFGQTSAYVMFSGGLFTIFEFWCVLPILLNVSMFRNRRKYTVPQAGPLTLLNRRMPGKAAARTGRYDL